MHNLLEFLNKNEKILIEAFLSHIELVLVSVGIGFVLSVPLGILLSRYKKAARITLAGIGLIQTIPGLVLLGFALLLFGLGKLPAIAVLALYAILPILQNTYTGICGVDKSLIEAGKGSGMTDLQILMKIELPLSLSSIIAGLRISTVYIISWATLAALIGAGGLGDLIWTGLASYDKNLVLAGAIPASLIALMTGAFIKFLQNAVTPKGIRHL